MQKIFILTIILAFSSINILAEEATETKMEESAISEELSTENWVSLAELVATHLESASTLYAENKSKEAKREIISAYFGVFEDQKMEAAMRMELGAKYTYKVERRFGDLRKAIKKNLPIEEFNQQMQELITIMRADAIKLDEAGIPREVFNVE